MSTVSFVIFSAYYPPHMGGVENFTYHLGLELEKKGHEVTVVTSKTDNSPFVTKRGKLTIYRLLSLHAFNMRISVPVSLIQFMKLVRKLKRDHESVFIVNTRLYPLSLIGVVLGKILGKKTFLLEHGSGHVAFNNKAVDSIFHCYEHCLTNIIKRFRPEYCGVSEDCNTWLSHFGINSKMVLPNGVDCSITVPSHMKTNTFVFGGRLIREKGVMESIEAFKRFQLAHPEYSLVIAGSGDLEKEVKTAIAQTPGIRYVGRMKPYKLQQVLSSSLCLLHPSSYPEGLPTVVLEAGMLGLPVIATPNGLRGLINDRENGIILSSSSPDDIYKALIFFHSHRKKMEKMGLALKNTIIKDYNWHTITTNFLRKAL